MGVTLFLGAGFSKWASNLPIANELFDFQIAPWKRESKRLETVRLLKEEWDKEHPSGLAEQFVADALSFPPKQREDVIWYIARRLSEPFVIHIEPFQRPERHILSIDDTHRPNIPAHIRRSIAKAGTFLHPLRSILLNGIITTNYDLLVEYTFGSKGFNYGVPNAYVKSRRMRRTYRAFDEWVQLTGRVPLVKIHGSISRDSNGYYGDGRCGLKGNALIVAPTPNKKPSEILSFEWELADAILRKSVYLVVFGFGFNPYDETALNLLRIGGTNLKSILLIDVDPKVEVAHELWPNATIISCQPPPQGYETIAQWTNDAFTALRQY